MTKWKTGECPDLDDKYLVEIKFGDGSTGHFIVTIDQYGSLVDDSNDDLCISWEDVERWIPFDEVKKLLCEKGE